MHKTGKINKANHHINQTWQTWFWLKRHHLSLFPLSGNSLCFAALHIWIILWALSSSFGFSLSPHPVFTLRTWFSLSCGLSTVNFDRVGWNQWLLLLLTNLRTPLLFNRLSVLSIKCKEMIIKKEESLCKVLFFPVLITRNKEKQQIVKIRHYA